MIQRKQILYLFFAGLVTLILLFIPFGNISTDLAYYEYTTFAVRDTTPDRTFILSVIGNALLLIATFAFLMCMAETYYRTPHTAHRIKHLLFANRNVFYNINHRNRESCKEYRERIGSKRKINACNCTHWHVAYISDWVYTSANDLLKTHKPQINILVNI